MGHGAWGIGHGAWGQGEQGGKGRKIATLSPTLRVRASVSQREAKATSPSFLASPHSLRCTHKYSQHGFQLF
ncbi:hypothetical protein [Nostoc linckia]|uniref:hypothetical protein n=3 Tax=Nostoc linckia TaxID=92942 RepID=UPI0015D51A22|nr:hypothetical protein [Nostoc linckia]